jgi:hypothetical protein
MKFEVVECKVYIVESESENSAQMAVEALQDEMFLGEKDFNEAKHGNCSTYGKVITMAETTNIFVA